MSQRETTNLSFSTALGKAKGELVGTCAGMLRERERGKAYKLRNFSTKGIKKCGTDVSIRWPVKASESLAGQMEGSSLPKALSTVWR